MKLDDELPRPFAWGARIVMYSIAFVVAIPLLTTYRAFSLVNHADECLAELPRRSSSDASPLNRTRQFGACLYKKSGFIESVFMESSLKHILALPSPTCRYVGVWKGTRNGTSYRHILKDNSEFLSEPMDEASDNQGSYTGNWGEHDGSLIWMTDENLWPPDVNKIVDETSTGFTLIERNGQRTQFALLQRLDSNVCAR